MPVVRVGVAALINNTTAEGNKLVVGVRKGSGHGVGEFSFMSPSLLPVTTIPFFFPGKLHGEERKKARKKKLDKNCGLPYLAFHIQYKKAVALLTAYLT